MTKRNNWLINIRWENGDSLYNSNTSLRKYFLTDALTHIPTVQRNCFFARQSKGGRQIRPFFPLRYCVTAPNVTKHLNSYLLVFSLSLSLSSCRWHLFCYAYEVIFSFPGTLLSARALCDNVFSCRVCILYASAFAVSVFVSFATQFRFPVDNLLKKKIQLCTVSLFTAHCLNISWYIYCVWCCCSSVIGKRTIPGIEKRVEWSTRTCERCRKGMIETWKREDEKTKNWSNVHKTIWNERVPRSWHELNICL